MNILLSWYVIVTLSPTPCSIPPPPPLDGSALSKVNARLSDLERVAEELYRWRQRDARNVSKCSLSSKPCLTIHSVLSRSDLILVTLITQPATTLPPPTASMANTMTQSQVDGLGSSFASYHMHDLLQQKELSVNPVLPRVILPLYRYPFSLTPSHPSSDHLHSQATLSRSHSWGLVRGEGMLFENTQSPPLGMWCCKIVRVCFLSNPRLWHERLVNRAFLFFSFILSIIYN